MKRLRRLKMGFAAAAVAVGVTCAMTMSAGPAVAYYSGGLFLDIAAQSPATLIAKGAAVDISLEYTCNAQTPYVTVSVSQRVANGDLATGSATVQVGCTGAHQRTIVTVQASGSKAFVRGNASVASGISGCLPNYTTCGAEYDNATVSFRR